MGQLLDPHQVQLILQKQEELRDGAQDFELAIYSRADPPPKVQGLAAESAQAGQADD